MLSVGGLFSGIGGYELGLERAGMRIAWHCESDPFCRAVLERHWPGVPCYPDVRELEGAGVEPVDVLCGGFPCQDLSLAGKGAGLAGARSGLWGEYARLIGELRPRYVLVENVAALLARGLDRVLGELATLGYDAEWDCIPASAVGAPHKRDRVWLVAYPRGDAAAGAREAAGAARADPDPDGRRCEVLGVEEPAGVEGARRRVADGLREVRELADATPTDMADAEGEPVGTGLREDGPREERRRRPGDGDCARGAEGAAEPDVRGVADGLPAGVDRRGAADPWAEEWPGIPRVGYGIPNRTARLRALGNALVPQIAEWVGLRVLEWEEG